jgi:hypothetical protein
LVSVKDNREFKLHENEDDELVGYREAFGPENIFVEGSDTPAWAIID